MIAKYCIIDLELAYLILSDCSDKCKPALSPCPWLFLIPDRTGHYQDKIISQHRCEHTQHLEMWNKQTPFSTLGSTHVWVSVPSWQYCTAWSPLSQWCISFQILLSEHHWDVKRKFGGSRGRNTFLLLLLLKHWALFRLGTILCVLILHFKKNENAWVMTLQ